MAAVSICKTSPVKSLLFCAGFVEVTTTKDRARRGSLSRPHPQTETFGCAQEDIHEDGNLYSIFTLFPDSGALCLLGHVRPGLTRLRILEAFKEMDPENWKNNCNIQEKGT